MFDRILNGPPPPKESDLPRLGLFDIQRRFIPAGSVDKFDTSDWYVEWIIISVSSGSMGVWPGYNVNPDNSPVWQFNAGQPPVWLPVGFTGDRFVLTAKALGTDPVEGCVIFVARHNRGFDYSR